MRIALSITLALSSPLFHIPSFCYRSREIPAAVEEQAIKPYNGLTDYWKKRAIKAWRAEYMRTANPSYLEKNDPPFYPPLLNDDPTIKGARLRKGNWGHLDATTVGGGRGIYVEKILGENRLIAVLGERFILEGIETKGVIQGRVSRFPGVFHAAGLETYGPQSLMVIKPLPQIYNL